MLSPDPFSWTSCLYVISFFFRDFNGRPNLNAPFSIITPCTPAPPRAKGFKFNPSQGTVSPSFSQRICTPYPRVSFHPCCPISFGCPSSPIFFLGSQCSPVPTDFSCVGFLISLCVSLLFFFMCPCFFFV